MSYDPKDVIGVAICTLCGEPYHIASQNHVCNIPDKDDIQKLKDMLKKEPPGSKLFRDKLDEYEEKQDEEKQSAEEIAARIARMIADKWTGWRFPEEVAPDIADEIQPLVEAQRKHEWLIAQWKAEEIMWHDQEDADAKEIASLKEELRESEANHNNLKDVYKDAEEECKALKKALTTIRNYGAKDPTQWAVDVANIAADALKYEDEDEEELDCTGVKKKNWL